MKKKYIGLLVAAVAVLSMLSACSAPKDITYMQGFDNGMAQEVRSQSRITAQPDDRLGIYVHLHHLPKIQDYAIQVIAQ